MKNTIRAYRVIGIAIFLLIIFYEAVYWQDSQLDFVPLYVAGHMWRTSNEHAYYTYDEVVLKEGLLIQTPLSYEQYARNLGYAAKYPPPLFIYFPAFIPLFALFSVIPLFAASKLCIAVSTLTFFIVIGLILKKEFPAHHVASGFLVAVLILFYSAPVCWSIGSGQMTLYLFAGTWLSLYLQSRRRPFLAGILLATVTWFKFFPGLIVLYWIFVKDYKALISFTATMLSIFFAGLGLFGPAVLRDYSDLLRALSGGSILALINQSFEAFLMRFDYTTSFVREIVNTPVWLSVKLIALFCKTLLLFSWLYFTKKESAIAPGGNDISPAGASRGSPYYAMAIMILLLPLTWVHYFIFVIPLCIWIARPLHEKRENSGMFYIVFACALLLIFAPSGLSAYVAGKLSGLGDERVMQGLKNIISSTPLLGSILLFLLAHIRLGYEMQPR